jgi:hypothetical protein
MTPLAIFAPIVGFALLTLLFQNGERSWRKVVLHAAIVWGALVVLMTELLSLPHLLTYNALTTAWLVFDVAGVGGLVALRRDQLRHGFWSATPARLKAHELLMFCGVGCIVTVVGLIAIVSAPNTWDAMESHLPRAFFWMQNRTVGFYPTPEFIQNLAPPFAAFVVAQSFILLGSDAAANCIQWLSMIGTLIGVSLIAGRLGGGRGAQILAALICATIPEGLLEASGAGNTYVVTFWIVTAMYFLLQCDEEPSWLNRISLAGAIGLAVLTKGTAYTILPPLLAAGWLFGSGPTRLAVIRAIPVGALVILALNAGSYIRNFQLTGLVLGVPYPPAGPLAGGYANIPLFLSRRAPPTSCGTCRFIWACLAAKSCWRQCLSARWA